MAMDEVTRLSSDVSQLTRRVDDLSLRLAVTENTQKYYDTKLDDLKELIVANNVVLTKSIDRWNAIGLWIIGTFAGGIILAFIAFIVNGGLKVVV